MKKIILIIVIVFQTGLISAQVRDNVGHRVGSWNISAHNCFKGLIWKIRKSYYSDNSENYTNEIEIKNNYGSAVTFSYNMSENANETTTRYRKTLTPGQTYTSTYCPNVNLVTFYVAEVCFNNNCKSGCFALCDNGSPNQPECNSKTNNTTNTGSLYNQPATNSNQSQTYSKPATTYSNSQSVNVQQKTEAFNQLSQATISLLGSIQDGARKKRELKQQQEANRNQQIVDNFNSNKEYYYDIISMENEELGYYADYVAYQFEKHGYRLRKTPYSLIVGVPPYTKYGGRKNCYMYFIKETDTLFASITINLTDYKEENMKKFNKLERIISVSSLGNSKPISQADLKNLFTLLFGNIITDISTSGNKKHSFANAKISISPQDARSITAGIDFNNSSYLGHKIEFTKAISLDTTNTKEAYKRNAYIYYSGLTGQLSDYDEAIEWYAKAAALGDTSSLSMMADIYVLKGQNDPQNYGMAMRISKELASYECIYSTSAMLRIAGMYERGNGIPKDCDLAIEWYEKAANSKNLSSYLGLMYLTSIYGKYGCKPDKKLEKIWKEKLCLADPENFHCK